MSFMESIPRPVKTYRTQTYDRISRQHGFHGHGKKVLITGGASGIGRNIAFAFASAGVARVAIVSRSLEAQQTFKADFEKQFPSTKLLLHQASITDESRMTSILEEIGTIDVLVLNAAIAHPRLTASQCDTSTVADAFAVNTQALFHLTRTYLTMLQPASKTILNVSTGAIHLPGSPRVAYGASKAAAVHLLQAFAAEFPHTSTPDGAGEEEQVRIVSFHPGSVYTPGVAANMKKDWMTWDDERLAADFAVWLAGSEAGFLHGRFVWANWDVDELMALKSRCEQEKGFLTLGLVL